MLTTEIKSAYALINNIIIWSYEAMYDYAAEQKLMATSKYSRLLYL